MHNISDKDKKIWNYYISNINSIKKTDKYKQYNSIRTSLVSKVLKSNISFSLDNKTKKQINRKKLTFDAIIDLHGKTEFEAYEIIKKFIKNNYLKNLKNLIIITGKGINNQGKLKLKTPLWLKSEELSKFVVGFENMPHNKGGEGAIFVKLKNINKYK